LWPSFVLGKNPIVVNIFIQTTGTAYPSGASLVFSGVRVTRSLVLFLYFVDRCLSFCPFSFGHCVVCTSSIYGFWLPLWYLQTLLRSIGSLFCRTSIIDMITTTDIYIYIYILYIKFKIMTTSYLQKLVQSYVRVGILLTRQSPYMAASVQ
jgi:hypothetical protein